MMQQITSVAGVSVKIKLTKPQLRFLSQLSLRLYGNDCATRMNEGDIRLFVWAPAENALVTQVTNINSLVVGSTKPKNVAASEERMVRLGIFFREFDESVVDRFSNALSAKPSVIIKTPSDAPAQYLFVSDDFEVSLSIFYQQPLYTWYVL